MNSTTEFLKLQFNQVSNILLKNELLLSVSDTSKTEENFLIGKYRENYTSFDTANGKIIILKTRYIIEGDHRTMKGVKTTESQKTTPAYPILFASYVRTSLGI